MILMAEELSNGIMYNQSFRVYKDCLIEAIRIGFLKVYTMPPGSYFTWYLYGPNGLITNGSYTNSQINTACPGLGWNGMLKLESDELTKGIPIRVDGEYIELTVSIQVDGTFTAPAWVGLIRDENPNYEIYGDTVLTGIENQDMWLNPFKLEVYTA